MLWTCLSLPPQEVKRHLGTFPWSEAGIKMSPLFSLHFWPHSKDIFITLCHHQVSHQATPVKSTPLRLIAGWIFISHQSESRTNTKIFTHNSMPDILVVICISSGFGGEISMCNPVFCEFLTQQVGHSTNFNYKYPHCLIRWVGPNHLLPFQVSVVVFVLGCRDELLRFNPFLWVKPNSSLKFSDYIWAHLGTTYSTPHSHSMNTLHRSFNQFRIHWSHSLPFNNFKQGQNCGSGVYSPGISIPPIQSSTILIKSIFPSRYYDLPYQNVMKG